MIDKREVWDIAPDSLKLELFPVVVQAMYNALIVLGSMVGDKLTVPDDEISKTVWDLRNANNALYSVGIKPVFKKRIDDNGKVELKHISVGPVDSLCKEYADEIKERMQIWDMEQYDDKMSKIASLQRKLHIANLRLHIWKKYGHDMENVNETETEEDSE